MTIAPNKSQYLANTNTSPFNVDGRPIPASATIQYLGIPLTKQGIDLEQNTQERKMANFWGCCDRLVGFSTQASTRLYKTFVRPTLEYGLQLQALDSENSNRLERIQRAALLTIFSAPMKTSVDAMHKLILLESMAMRSHILNFIK